MASQADMVLKSIGYAALPLEGLGFDPKRGVALHRDGRALVPGPQDTEDVGLYVCGWLKRGPSGIIGCLPSLLFVGLVGFGVLLQGHSIPSPCLVPHPTTHTRAREDVIGCL